MKVNVYIKNESGCRMEQLEASSINEAAEIVAMYLDDGEEIVFSEDNMNPQFHTF